MKNVIFNILTVLMLLATVGVGAVYAAVLFSGGGPDLSALSSISVAPAQELPTAMILPTSTATARKMAPTWTETVNAVATYDAARRLASSTPIPGSIGGGGGGVVFSTATQYTIPSNTPIPTNTLVPTVTNTPVTPTYTPSNTWTPYPTSTPLPTSTPRPTDNRTLTALAQYSIQNSVTAQAMTLAVAQIYQTQTFVAQTAQASAAPGQTAIAATATANAAALQTLAATSQAAAQTQTAIVVGPTLTVQGLPANPTRAVETAHGIATGAWQSTYNNPTFQWFNPVGATAYFVYWGPDPNGDADFSTPMNVTTSPTSYTPTAIPTGSEVTYYLRVRTKFGAIERNDYTTLFTFRYDNKPPTNPDSASETHGARDDTWQGSVKSPTFNVSGGSDGGSGIQYKFYFGTNASGIPGGSGQASATYSPGSQADNVYYLIVQAIDNQGNLNPATASLFTFRLDATAPTKPNLSWAPGNTGSLKLDPFGRGEPDTYNHDTPIFSWNASNDPPSGPDNVSSGLLNYDVFWGTDGAAALGNPNPVPVTATVSSPGFSAPQMTPNVYYYLRARARDKAGNVSGWSDNIFAVKFVPGP